MPDFVSKMQMHSQETPRTVVNAERAVVAADLAIGNDSMERIVFDDEGWSSRVYLVDGGEVAYKFPRSPEVITDYKQEISALAMLATMGSPLPTQRFRAMGADGSFSYHGLVGTQLSEQLQTLNPDTKFAIGERLGNFLAYLHQQDMPNMPKISLKEEVKEYQDKHDLAVPAIEAHFNDKERRVVADFYYEELPAEIVRLGMMQRLCHGDLGTYNVIVGTDGVPGIIDFGNIGYYDNSKDFIDFGDDMLLEGALRTYGDNAALRDKITVRTVALQAIDLVYYMAKQDSASVATTANRLRSLLIDKVNT